MSCLIRRVLAKPRLILDGMCRLYGKFASYLKRVLCRTRLIFPRINGPKISFEGKCCWEIDNSGFLRGFDVWNSCYMLLVRILLAQANIFAIFGVWCVRNRFVTTASVKAVVQAALLNGVFR